MAPRRALFFVIALSGCGLNVVGLSTGSAEVGETPDANDGPTIGREAAAGPADVDRASDAEAGSAIDATPVEAAVDGGGGSCAACPKGTARMLCINSACKPTRRVFVTKATFRGDFGGFAGADAACLAAATTAGLGGTWMAWLSSGPTGNSRSPQDRFPPTTDPWSLVNGTVIATRAELLSADQTRLRHPIDLDETGATPPGATEVWTGTGVYAYATGARCGNEWTSSTSTGTVGVYTEMTGSWTDKYPQSCDRVNVHLYCFEQ